MLWTKPCSSADCRRKLHCQRTVQIIFKPFCSLFHIDSRWHSTSLLLFHSMSTVHVSEGLSTLEPDLIHIDLTPQSIWYETGSHGVLYTRPNYGRVKAYLPLAGTQSSFWISHPPGSGPCLFPIRPTTCSFLVDSKNSLTSSTNTCFN